MLSYSEYEKALTAVSDQWAPDNKRDPPEEIYSHYFIWHGGRTAYIIHASCNILLTSVKDIWTGIHLDKIGQSQPPNWTYAKCRGWCTVLNNVSLWCTLLWEWNVCTEARNDTCLLLMQPETDSLNTALTLDLLTFEYHSVGLHCFSSWLLIGINPTIIKHLSYMPGCSVWVTQLYCWFLLLTLCNYIVIIDIVKNVAHFPLLSVMVLFVQLKIVIASSLAVANREVNRPTITVYPLPQTMNITCWVY